MYTDRIDYISVAALVTTREPKEKLLLVKKAKGEAHGWDLIFGKSKQGEGKLRQTVKNEIHGESGAPIKRIKILRSSKELGIILCGFFNETKGKLVLCVQASIPAKKKFKRNAEIRGHRLVTANGKISDKLKKLLTDPRAKDRLALCLQARESGVPMLMRYRFRNKSPGLKAVAYKSLGTEPLNIRWLKQHKLVLEDLA